MGNLSIKLLLTYFIFGILAVSSLVSPAITQINTATNNTTASPTLMNAVESSQTTTAGSNQPALTTRNVTQNTNSSTKTTSTQTKTSMGTTKMPLSSTNSTSIIEIGSGKKSTTYRPVSSTVVNMEGTETDNEFMNYTNSPAPAGGKTTRKSSTSSTTQQFNKTTLPHVSNTKWEDITVSPITAKSTTLKPASSTKIVHSDSTLSSFTSSGDDETDFSGDEMFTFSSVRTSSSNHSSIVFTSPTTTQKTTLVTNIPKSSTILSTIKPDSVTTSMDMSSNEYSGSGDDDLSFTTIFPVSKDTQTVKMSTSISDVVTEESSGESSGEGLTKSTLLPTGSTFITDMLTAEEVSKDTQTVKMSTSISDVVTEELSGESSGEILTTSTVLPTGSTFITDMLTAEEGSGEETSVTTSSVMPDTFSGEGSGEDVYTSPFPSSSQSVDYTTTDSSITATTSSAIMDTFSGEGSGDEDFTSPSGNTSQSTSTSATEPGITSDSFVTTSSVIADTFSGEGSGDDVFTYPFTSSSDIITDSVTQSSVITDTFSGEGSGEELFTSSSSSPATSADIIITSSGEIDTITTDTLETASGETTSEGLTSFTTSSTAFKYTASDVPMDTASGETSGSEDFTVSSIDTTVFTDITTTNTQFNISEMTTDTQFNISETSSSFTTDEVKATNETVTGVPSTVIGEVTTEATYTDEEFFTREKSTTMLATTETTTSDSTVGQMTTVKQPTEAPSTVVGDVTTDIGITDEGMFTTETRSKVSTTTAGSIEEASTLVGVGETQTTTTLKEPMTTTIIMEEVTTPSPSTSSTTMEMVTTKTVPVTTEAVVQTSKGVEITTVEPSTEASSTSTVPRKVTTETMSVTTTSIPTTTLKDKVTTQTVTTKGSVTTTTEASTTVPTTVPIKTTSDQKATVAITTEAPVISTTGSTKKQTIFSSVTTVLPGVTIQGDIRIINGIDYSPELGDTSSAPYKVASEDVTNLVTEVFQGGVLRNDFVSVNGISFRQGSVLVTYILTFKPAANISESDALKAFWSSTNNGTTLGKYTLDPTYNRFTAITGGSTTPFTTLPSTTASPSTTTTVVRPPIIEYRIPGWAIGVILALAILLVFFILFCIIWCCCNASRESAFYRVPHSNASYTDSLNGEFTLSAKPELQLLGGAYNVMEKDEKALSETIGGSTRGSLHDRSISIPRKIRVPLNTADGNGGGEVNMAATGDDGYDNDSPGGGSAASTVVATNRDNFIHEIDLDFKDFFIIQVDDDKPKSDINILDENYPYNQNNASHLQATNSSPDMYQSGWSYVGDNGVMVFNFSEGADTYYDENLNTWNTRL